MYLTPSRLALTACAILLASPAWAETAIPSPGAKRVTPPAPGTQRRITVQIRPGDETWVSDRPAPAGKPDNQTANEGGPDVQPASPGRYAWFWARVPTELDHPGTERLEAALATLSADGSVATPSLQSLMEIVQARGPAILKETVGTRVSPALALAVIAVESSGQADAVSHAGAEGLMQLMPDTADRFGVADSLKPEQNIAGGVKYLDWLLEEFGGDPILALAGYNAGEGAVRKFGGVPPYAETRDYVPKVLAAYRMARGLCVTPPELISDGCVFAAMTR